LELDHQLLHLQQQAQAHLPSQPQFLALLLIPHLAQVKSALQGQELSKKFPIQQQALAQSPSMDLQLQIYSLQHLLQVHSLLQLQDMPTSAAQQSMVAIE
jgi:hypothetical protein